MGLPFAIFAFMASSHRRAFPELYVASLVAAGDEDRLRVPDNVRYGGITGSIQVLGMISVATEFSLHMPLT